MHVMLVKVFTSIPRDLNMHISVEDHHQEALCQHVSFIVTSVVHSFV